MKKKIFSVMLCMAMAATMAAGCSNGASKETKATNGEAKTEDTDKASDSGDKKYVIGVSQGTMNHPFRVAMVDENVKLRRKIIRNLNVLQRTDRTIPQRRCRMWKTFWPAASICC